MCEAVKGSTDTPEIQGELRETASLLRQLYVSLMQRVVTGGLRVNAKYWTLFSSFSTSPLPSVSPAE